MAAIAKFWYESYTTGKVPPEAHRFAIAVEDHADHAFGMADLMHNVPFKAFVYGLISASSLPLGAFLGDYYSPVRGEVVAGMMAFGSGALLFAVTVELYGAALMELHHHPGQTGQYEIYVTIGGAVIGALGYLYLNLWLEDYMEHHEKHEEGHVYDDDPNLQQARPPVSSADSGSEVWDPSAGGSGGGVRRVRLGDEEIVPPDETTPLNKFRRASQRIARQTRTNASMMAAKRFTVREAIAKLPVLQEEQKQMDAEQGGEDETKRKNKGFQVALAVFLGVLADGVPEAVLMGFLAAQNSLSLVLIAALFVANFPEAFASASLMAEAGISKVTTIGMWSGLCLLTGVLCGLACWGLLLVAPDGKLTMEMEFIVAGVEGLAGGAMIACIAGVMLPEAFERAAKRPPIISSGFLCCAGFLASVAMKVMGGDVH